jgi:hypothetical protein
LFVFDCLPDDRSVLVTATSEHVQSNLDGKGPVSVFKTVGTSITVTKQNRPPIAFHKRNLITRKNNHASLQL